MYRNLFVTCAIEQFGVIATSLDDLISILDTELHQRGEAIRKMKKAERLG